MKNIFITCIILISIPLVLNSKSLGELELKINSYCHAYDRFPDIITSEYFEIDIENKSSFILSDVAYQLNNGESAIKLYKDEAVNYSFIMLSLDTKNQQKKDETLSFMEPKQLVSIGANVEKNKISFGTKSEYNSFSYQIDKSINADTFVKFIKTDTLTLDRKVKTTHIKKVKVKDPLSFSLFGQEKQKYIYKDETTYSYKTDHYNIKNYATAWKGAQEQCKNQIENQKYDINIERMNIVTVIIIGLVVLFFIIRSLIIFIKKKIVLAKEKVIELKREREEQRVRNIAEDESIRVSVKKSMDNSSDAELEVLQNLINEAVAKGDSETAQALLKILNSKKDTK